MTVDFGESCPVQGVFSVVHATLNEQRGGMLGFQLENRAPSGTPKSAVAVQTTPCIPQCWSAAPHEKQNGKPAGAWCATPRPMLSGAG